MRNAMMAGSAMVLILAFSALLPSLAGGQGPRGSVYASAGQSESTSEGTLVSHFAASSSGPHTVTVIDPARQVMGVYHIDSATGSITLQSVRNLSWDLRMIQFNSEDPSPQDVRGGLDSAKVSGTTTPSQLVRPTEQEASRRGPVAAAP